MFIAYLSLTPTAFDIVDLYFFANPMFVFIWLLIPSTALLVVEGSTNFVR